MMEVTVSSEGVEEIQRMIRKINSMFNTPGRIKGCKIYAVTRDNGGASNTEILDHLRELGYDFVTLTRGDENRIASAFEKEMQKWLDSGKATRADAILSSALKAAIQTLGIIIEEKIESDPYNGELSEAYEAWKELKFGDAYPVGIATRQLIDNLLSRRVKFTR